MLVLECEDFDLLLAARSLSAKQFQAPESSMRITLAYVHGKLHDSTEELTCECGRCGANFTSVS